ncbi:MAG: DUF4175 domain-containing protein [Sphingobacteriales bacterium]|jgi:hypothetical protein|nr:DUF4175 domain-containing protein [Sphingobacteriales bacterium]MBP9140271.1 hypothetical protein [Chitinophagales bacterium]MDA0197202.1 DUF4175 domain-containing protein [Bacteroidota bacterium]MBK6891447.1 DUF4175 domain-containing protein [Sphingobacteriales bacterium]MBK7526721.1 DUF4175 domain-containing protein [Sphingobacteriales bacterium]
MSAYANLNTNYHLLLQKLDQFIRKYYLNKLLRGTLYTIGVVLAAFLIISISEYYLYFSTTIRKILFWGFIALAAGIGWWGVLQPLLQFFKLGRIITHEQAAAIVGAHFINVKDKLLNILQLKHQATSLTDRDLIEASINQKIDDIKPVPFVGAINLAKNKQYVKYAAIPLLSLLVLAYLAPNLLRESTERLINNNQEYAPKAPFTFKLLTQNLEVVQNQDITLQVKTEGSVIPNEAFLHINNFPYKLTKGEQSGEFFYKLSNVQKSAVFYFDANGFRSNDYNLTVIPKPSLLNFDAALNYPDYVDKKDEVLRNSGDMVVPAGTNVTWTFEAENTETVSLRFGPSGSPETNATPSSGNKFEITKRLFQNTSYTVYLSSQKLPKADSMTYMITVIPDAHPTISVEEQRDSTDAKFRYFMGDASDDYGLKSMYFKYRISPAEVSADGPYQQTNIGIEPGRKIATYTYTWDLAKLSLKPGDRLTYFFEVWDNDAVNGSKFARTQIMSYQAPTNKEMEQLAQQKNEDVKNDLDKALKDLQQFQEDMKDIQQRLLQKKELNWQDKQQIQDLLNKRQEMQERIEQAKNNFNENLKNQQEFKEFSEQTKEKYEKLQDLMDKMMTDEMKKLMDKLAQMLEQMNKDEMMKKMEDFKMSDEQLQDELDRMMELFKELQFEQKMEETIDKLNKLAEEQKKLGEETEKNSDNSLEDNKKEQEKATEKFDELKKDIKELDKLAEELKKEKDIQGDTEKQQEEISNEQEQSEQQMQQNNKQSASDKQKKAGQKMKEMAEQMQEMQQEMQQEQAEEDMKSIRQLLENLVRLSMDQEELMEDLKKTNINNPRYVKLLQQQNKLRDDSEMVRDSLVALSKRVFQLEAFITSELTELSRNMGDALSNLAERRVAPAATNQQFVMTSLNNLALMLDEAMQQMQQQMAEQQQQSGGSCKNCKKPGKGKGGKPSMKGMGQMQKQLNDQISKLQQDIKEGKKPGGKQMSKEAAQLAQQQEALRRSLEEMAKKMEGNDGKKGEKGQEGNNGKSGNDKTDERKNKDGKGEEKNKQARELRDLAKEMERTETELVNRKLTADMVKRQQEILTRMLKVEESEREQEWDDKRQAETAQNRTPNPPPAFEEFIKKRQSETDLYRTVPPNLKPYYKQLAEKYFKSISY